MLYSKTENNVKVWRVNPKEKCIDLQISSGKKGQEEGTRVYSNWNGRLVGKAFQHLKDKVNEGNVLVLKEWGIENRKVEDNGITKYFTDVVIFDAELYNSNNSSNSQPRPQQPQTQYQQPTQNQAQPQYIDDDTLPF